MKPWEYPGSIWSTQAKYFSWLRGQFRRIWSRYPLKNSFVKERRYRIMSGSREVWGGKCECCGGEFKQSMLQVDHGIPAGSLNEVVDIQGFIERLLLSNPDTWSLLCKPCHKIKTIAERKGCSYEEAIIAQKVAGFKKLKASGQRDLLYRFHVKPGKSSKDRVKQYEEIVKTTIV